MKEPTQHARTYANPFCRSNFWFISVHNGAADLPHDFPHDLPHVHNGSRRCALKSAEILEQVRMSMAIRSNVTNRE